MLHTLRRIYSDAAGFAKRKADSFYNQFKDHKNLVGGTAAAAAASAAIYDKAFDAGRELYRITRRADGVTNMVANSDENSADARHRRRTLGYAQRAAQKIRDKALQKQVQTPINQYQPM